MGLDERLTRARLEEVPIPVQPCPDLPGPLLHTLNLALLCGIERTYRFAGELLFGRHGSQPHASQHDWQSLLAPPAHAPLPTGTSGGLLHGSYGIGRKTASSSPNCFSMDYFHGQDDHHRHLVDRLRPDTLLVPSEASSKINVSNGKYYQFSKRT